MAYNNINTMHNITLHLLYAIILSLLYAIIPCLAVNIVSLIFGTAILHPLKIFYSGTLMTQNELLTTKRYGNIKLDTNRKIQTAKYKI